MIKIEHMVLPSPEQMEFIIEGLRNPMNSWDRSDSEYGCCNIDICPENKDTSCDNCPEWVLGTNDLSLMRKLSVAGTVHRKYMRMMPVFVRITAPLYWWKEFDTYKIGTVANSCSTMHKIQEKEFDISDFSHEHLWPDEIQLLEDIVNQLNKRRAYYLEYDNLYDKDSLEYSKKDIWWQMIQLLPSSYNQTRNVMLNYEVLTNIYYSPRWNHKLDEWVEFCEWMKTLPYSELIINHEIKEEM